MNATPKENIKRFKTKLAGLKRLRRFISWSESAGFAGELKALLEDLRAGVDDPCTGAELVAAFYETDAGTFGSCDDSSGYVGDVYRCDARELFVWYASRCENKELLAELVLKLNREDDYGVRDALIDCAAEYLPEPNIRTMISRLQDLAANESDEYRRRHWLFRIESLARQIKDAPLFERTRVAAWGSLSTAACVDIGRVYLESSDAGTALSWLDRIPVTEAFMAHERDQLLLDIHGRLGNAEKQAEVAWRMFKRSRCGISLCRLLAVIGEDKRDAVIEGEVAVISQAKALSLSDAAFLIEIGRVDEAETCLIDRRDQLNGDFYTYLLPMAEVMEKGGRLLGATVVYRALLESILQRARTKTYPHGVRYLKRLDKIAKHVTGWGDVDGHAVYAGNLRQKHGRKTSFWSRYE